jgi:hypothetical protein
MGQFIDEQDLWVAHQSGIKIELAQQNATMLNRACRKLLKPIEQRLGFGAAPKKIVRRPCCWRCCSANTSASSLSGSGRCIGYC